MNTTDIEHLHERALDLYIAGRYLEARRAWQEILSIEPDDARAKEGARMVEILVEEQPDAAPETFRATAAGDLQGSAWAEASRIEELSARGNYREAAEAARRLADDHPQSATARDLLGFTRERLEADAFIEAELSRALRDLQLDDVDDARRACGNVLALDPQHARAHELLGLAEELRAETARAGAPPSPASSETAPTSVPVADRGAPRQQLDAGSLHATGDSVSGSLFEMPEEEIETLPLQDEALPERSEAAASADKVDAQAASLTEPLFEMEEGAPIPLGEMEPTFDAEGLAAWEPSPQAAGERRRESSAFSEIEAEIDESLVAPSAEGDLSLDTDASQGYSAPSAPSGETTLAADLSFDDVIGEASPDGEDDSWTRSAASGQTSADRISSLIREARHHMAEGRYSDAIESAARAFAIDEAAPGTRELIDQAQSLQNEADRKADELLEAGRHHIEAGDDASAELVLKQVLLVHPGHREVLEMLDGISRRRTEKEIISGAFLSTTDRGSHQEGRAPGMGDQAMHAPPAPPHPAQEAEPVPESMMPRSHGAEAPSRASGGTATQVAKESASAAPRKRGKRLLFVVVLAGGLALAGVIGVYLASRMLAPDEQVDLHPANQGRARKQVVYLDKTPAQRGPAADLSLPPRTLPEAKRLLASGRLDEARAVLMTLVAKDPTSEDSVVLLKSVQDSIVQRDETARAMESIASAYKQERYEDALRMLYRLPGEEHQSDIAQFKANAWYNNGIQFLLGGNCTEAIRCFDEALALNPRDAGARRLKDYAGTYLGREKDTAYLIYVENLPRRPLNHK